MQDNFDIQKIYEVIPKEIIKNICDNYKLDLSTSLHGINHWARVLENGIILSEYNGANKKVIIAFSFFHSALRDNEEHDPEEGIKGATLLNYYEEELNMTEEEINKASIACKEFVYKNKNEDKDIFTCFDSQNLDSMRSGLYPDKKDMHTEAAKNIGIITWAMKRGMNNHISDWVFELIEDIKND